MSSSEQTSHSRLCPPPLRVIPLGPVVARIRALETEALAALKGAVADGFRGIGAVMDRLVPLERVFWRLHARNERVAAKRAMLADPAVRAEVREALGGLAALRAWEARARALEVAEREAAERELEETDAAAATGDEGRLAAGRAAVAGDAEAPVSASGEVPEWYLRMRGEEALAAAEGEASESEPAVESGGGEGLRPCVRGDEGCGGGERGPGDADSLGPCRRRGERGDLAWRLPRLRRRLEGRRGAARRARRPRRAPEGRKQVSREARIAVWPCELMTRAERRGKGVSFRMRAQDRAPVVVGGLVIQPVELPYPDF